MRTPKSKQDFLFNTNRLIAFKTQKEGAPK